MAPKASPKKVISNEDKVKTGCILDKNGFLPQHDNSNEAKKIIKAFEDSRLLYLVTFNYQRSHKKEIVELHLNATIAGGGTIKSRGGSYC